MSDLQCAATILVVRHGESEDNVERRLASAVPGGPLTSTGRVQAAALAERLHGRGIARVYASPLLRAQQTGQLLADAFRVGLRTLDGVRELSNGHREGSTADGDWAEIGTTVLRWLDGDLATAVDGGETGYDVVRRVRSDLQDLADLHRGETVVVVSHAGAMSVALPRCADNVTDDYARERFVPCCGLVELSIDADGWRLVQWPGDPDLAPDPDDLVDLVGRANAQWLRASGARTEVHGVPCASFDIDAPWATQAALTGRAALPAPAELDDVLAWLENARPGDWQVRVRAEQADSPALRRLVRCLELGVWITERPPRYEMPDGAEIGEARDAGEFLEVFGNQLAPLLVGQFGVAGRSFPVLRVRGDTVGCARVTRTGGAAYVSGVVVRPDQRGHGYGRLLSAAAVDRAVHETGLAWLHCEDALAPLYENVGLRRLTTHVDLQPPGCGPSYGGRPGARFPAEKTTPRH